MTVYGVVGYILTNEPVSPKFVRVVNNEPEAKSLAINFCKRNGTGTVKEVNDKYFSSDIGNSSFAEARIYPMELACSLSQD